VAVLTAWREVQAADRLRAGSLWHLGSHGWIFTTAAGHVLDAHTAQRQRERALAAAEVDVPGRVHMLRHAAASLILGDAQVPLRVASKVLGHSSTRLTADTYAHVHTTQKRAALGVVPDALGETASETASETV
jgi:integrase